MMLYMYIIYKVVEIIGKSLNKKINARLNISNKTIYLDI